MSSFGANKRVFNTLKMDEKRGLLTKTSEDNGKLLNELRWYLNLPNELKYLIPRITNYSDSDSSVSITMELYGYKALNTLWLEEENRPSKIWDKIFESLNTILSDMGKFKTDHTSGLQDKIIDSVLDMYKTKTIERLSKIKDNSEFLSFKDDVVINGREVWGLDRILEHLDSVCVDTGLFNGRDFNIIHGDLCLSNILYEPTYGFVRLIDPRGKFGSFYTFGDPYYELAKLSHSFMGNYDFYISDQFMISNDEHGYELRAMTYPAHQELKSRFMSWLRSQGVELNMIKLIQSLLFLSMIPLHSDRPRAQQAFMCQGLSDFYDVIQEIY